MAIAKFTGNSAWVLRTLWLIAAGLAAGVLVVRGDGLLTEKQLARMGVGSGTTASFSTRVAPGRSAHSFDSLQWGDHPTIRIIPGREVSVPAGAILTLTGWAVDSHDNRAFAAIGGRLDDTPQIVQAIVHLPRPDVAAALGTPSARNSGFVLHIDTYGLTLGRHTIVLRGLAADHQSAYALDPALEINVTDKRAAAQRTDAIDSVNGVVVGAATSPQAPLGLMRSAGRMSISGWGFITEGHRLATSITLVVDGFPAGNARYGLPRPDVARAYRDVRMSRTGFEGSLLLDSLTFGKHVIKVQFGLSDGSTLLSYSALYVNVLPQH
jgi:hypothetical protein